MVSGLTAGAEREQAVKLVAVTIKAATLVTVNFMIALVAGLLGQMLSKSGNTFFRELVERLLNMFQLHLIPFTI